MVTVTGAGGPVLRGPEGVRPGGFAGLSTCGSVWSCPVCAAKVAAGRAADLSVILTKVHTVGGCGYMVTLTVRHDRTTRLARLWDAVSAAWGRVTSGGQWRKESAGLLGWCKITETTHSPSNGWHVHAHALLTWDHDVDEVAAQETAWRMWRRWDAQLRRDGLSSSLAHGVKADRVRPGDAGLAEYFVKISRELTSSYAKSSRSGRSPFAIARDAVETGNWADVALWREWEQVSLGRQQMTWSQGERDLRRFAGLRDRCDEEIAADDAGGQDLVAVDGSGWAEIADTDESDELHAVLDRDGIDGACAWLDARGIGWWPVAGVSRGARLRPGQRLAVEARAVLRAPG